MNARAVIAVVLGFTLACGGVPEASPDPRPPNSNRRGDLDVYLPAAQLSREARAARDWEGLLQAGISMEQTAAGAEQRARGVGAQVQALHELERHSDAVDIMLRHSSDEVEFSSGDRTRLLIMAAESSVASGRSEFLGTFMLEAFELRCTALDEKGLRQVTETSRRLHEEAGLDVARWRTRVMNWAAASERTMAEVSTAAAALDH